VDLRQKLDRKTKTRRKSRNRIPRTSLEVMTKQKRKQKNVDLRHTEPCRPQSEGWWVWQWKTGKQKEE
jgi:hypothetical protein